jgi:hypothetical protein
MFKKVVCATDGSAGADLGLPYARTLSADADGELLVVHWWSTRRQQRARKPLHEHGNEATRTRSRRRLSTRSQTWFEQGANARLQIVATSPSGAAHKIADFAETSAPT